MASTEIRPVYTFELTAEEFRLVRLALTNRIKWPSKTGDAANELGELLASHMAARIEQLAKQYTTLMTNIACVALPKEGATRVSAEDGVDEVFVNGKWESEK